MTKWPNERLVKTRAVSGFIFLRLLCPAILNPRQVSDGIGKVKNEITFSKTELGSETFLVQHKCSVNRTIAIQSILHMCLISKRSFSLARLEFHESQGMPRHSFVLSRPPLVIARYSSLDYFFATHRKRTVSAIWMDQKYKCQGPLDTATLTML